MSLYKFFEKTLTKLRGYKYRSYRTIVEEKEDGYLITLEHYDTPILVVKLNECPNGIYLDDVDVVYINPYSTSDRQAISTFLWAMNYTLIKARNCYFYYCRDKVYKTFYSQNGIDEIWLYYGHLIVGKYLLSEYTRLFSVYKNWKVGKVENLYIAFKTNERIRKCYFGFYNGIKNEKNVVVFDRNHELVETEKLFFVDKDKHKNITNLILAHEV
mgnify:CR=1 FL=1